ncbi:hypothetical protein ALC60_02311 [Trachymyrmex zeteki]|uniref:Uncharacterized protein n=1 Tax=Mycetomoellerius zeteki TaxID=64791 RepID=A0A151XE59_9HYME|nr:hypothetical protein ALC60_02311 [Trachymyrmex zeteki]
MPVIVFGVSPRRLYCELRDYRVFITLNDLSQARAAQLGSARLWRESENLITFRMEFAPSLIWSVFKTYTRVYIPPLNTAYLNMPVTPSRSTESHANTNHNDGTARAEGAFEETVILYPARRRHAHLCLFWVMCVSTRNGDYRDGSPFQRPLVVKVRSRGSAEKARKTRSEKRSSSESGIHRDSAPSFTSSRRFFAKSDLCSDVSCRSLRPSRCLLFVVEGERKRSLKMRPGLRRATATRDENQQEGGSNETI